MEQQIVFLIVIGLISLVNWVLKRSAEIREDRKRERECSGIPEGDPFHPAPQPAERPASPRRPAIAPSPDMRRLMEALGLPPEEEEPPAVREDAPPALPAPTAFRPPVAPKPRSKNPGPRGAATPSAPISPATPLSAALGSRDGIRLAVVLREILGPPKAFTD